MKPIIRLTALGIMIIALVLPACLADAGSLANRHRLEFGVGYWDSGFLLDESRTGPGVVETTVHDLVGTVSYAHWMQESVAGYATLKGLLVETRSTTGASGTSDYTVVVSSAVFGIRYYPVSGPQTSLRAFLSAGVGPYLGVESRTEIDPLAIKNTTTRTMGTVGGYLGGGLDLQMGRYFMLGVSAGYNLIADFPDPLAGQKNYSGPEVGLGISVLIGKGN
jgi:hypothetical protein